MGALFASGWTLDKVLSLTWDQLAFVVYSIQSHKSEQIRFIQEIIVVAMGGKVDNKKKKKKKQERSKAEQEQNKLRALQALGITINGPTENPG